jgi:hypothetical protein
MSVPGGLSEQGFFDTLPFHFARLNPTFSTKGNDPL